MPIFAGGSRRYRIAKSNSQIRNYEYAMQQVRDNAIKEITTAFSDIISAVEQLKISTQNMKSAEESLELSNYSFSQGQISIIDLMQAQVSWLSANNGMIAASYNYHIALSVYYKSTGTIFD